MQYYDSLGYLDALSRSIEVLARRRKRVVISYDGRSIKKAKLSMRTLE